MSAATELRISLDEVAGALELHPFDVARILGHRGELPPGLRFTRDDVERVRQLAGIELWWTGTTGLPGADPARTEALLRSLAKMLVERDRVADRTTRADNLLRGLGSDDRRRVRRLVNALITAKVLRTEASWRGLQVAVESGWADGLSRLAAGEPAGAVLPAAVLRNGGRR